MSQKHWDNLIEKMLGDDSPCYICAVKVMCNKSFAYRGGGCPELKQKIIEALRKKHAEMENEN